MPRQPFPGIVTAVEPQAKKHRGYGPRVNVFIDDRFSFALDAYLAMQRGVRPGLAIDVEQLSQLLREDGDSRAYTCALHFIGHRARSHKEVRARLERDNWPDEVIVRTIQRLSSEGLVNDAEFATQWVEARSLSRPRGGRALRYELRQKGVEREAIDAALPAADEELDNAVTAARSKLRSWTNLEERERRQKLIEFLQRRGFSYSTARAAIQQVEDEEE